MRPSTPATSLTPAARLEPWWRIPMVWLVIAGPAVVICACMVTLALAVAHPDPVVLETTPVVARSDSMTPALQARNHAAASR